MSIVFHELKKIFRPVPVLAVVLLSVVFYHTFISVSYPPFNLMYVNQESRDRQVYARLIDHYGNSLTPDESKDLKSSYIPACKANMSKLISQSKELKAAGICSYDDYKYFCKVRYFSTFISPDEMNKLNDDEFFENFGFKKSDCVPLSPAEEEVVRLCNTPETDLNEIAVLYQEIDAMEGIVSDESLYIRLDELKNRDDYNGAAKRRNDELFSSGEIYNLMNESTVDYFSQSLPLIIGMITVGLCILLSPVLTRDRMTGISSLQYTSKAGRKTLRKQLASMLTAAFAVTSAELAVCIALYLKDIPTQLWSSGLNSFGNWFSRYYFHGTMLEYVLCSAALAYVFVFAVTLAVFLISRSSKNYISLIFKLIPLTAIAVALIRLCFYGLFSYDFFYSDVPILSTLIPVPYIEVYLCVALLAVAAAVCTLVLKKCKTRDML